MCLVSQSCLTFCNPMNGKPLGSSVHGNSPGKNTGVGCHALLQGIFPTQGLNLGLLNCRENLYQLSYKGSPWKKSYDQPRQHIKKQDITLPTNVSLAKAMVFPVVMYGCESWTMEKAER